MNVYEIITDKIIGQLETGVVPWRKPWVAAGAPKNLISGKEYRGINTFLLGASKYVSPNWLTFKQAAELGGNVRKGEKATMIVFWKVSQFRDPDAQEGEISSADKTSFVLRYYNVFNVEQCENLPAEKIPAIETRENEPIAECERIVENMPQRPAIGHAGSQAFYSPRTDAVNLPPVNLFNSPEEYYATTFHELTHSTGHKSRLGREGIEERAEFGSTRYSKEELIAEMGSAFLCAEAGISARVIDNQAAYIQGWLKKLRDDRRCVVIAAAQAQKASDFILNRKAGE
jgi:antirestriction protein ArdC